jgi:alkylhydroperoxidase/carboxymuconolactone decarboxylase family protein YurZ
VGAHQLSRRDRSLVTIAALIYAGWPIAFSAVPVAKDVFEKRGN